MTDANLTAMFGAEGPLAACLTGFRPRPEQLTMAQNVAEALVEGHSLVVEAGTGTGKTLAYLLPALDSGLRIVISTGTKTLQDQLFHRDLPMIGKAVGRPVDAQLLKGRSNYLCLYRLNQLTSAADESSTPSRGADIELLRQWAERTLTGDTAEVSELPENSPLWPRVTSTVDNCLGSRCPLFDDCHVVAARHAAREAEMVVVNHHLLMADLAMKEEGFGQLLPGADALIIDEAHRFPDVAQGFFTIGFGTGQVLDLAGDVRSELVRGGAFDRPLEQALDELRKAAADARLTLSDGVANLPWDATRDDFKSAFDTLGASLDGVSSELAAIEDSSPGLQRCRQRAGAMFAAFEAIVSARDDQGLRWIRLARRTFTANVTPLDTAEELGALLESRPAAWVFTSATLAVRDNFQHFISRIGLQDVRTRQIPSPFPFADISRLYLPRGLPQPNDPEVTDRAVAEMRAAVIASGGHAFLLFTSHRALRRAAEILSDDSDFDFPLLVQGTEPRTRLLEQFAGQPRAVLLGTATFWEGIDIRGHDLVLVAIDRLPFASPGDPLLAARLEAIRSQGGNPFRDYQLPQAVLSLKQGVGRLIRDYDDYGVVMICDPRLTEKSYGRVFMSSLPPMPVVRDLDMIREFYVAHGVTES
ncbi:MAG: ATP-dependent DNA helicase [Gammaproteobacteria bacterium]|nr:ATP-dependent DNA helicase [Gammaproteobacteria bacterium]